MKTNPKRPLKRITLQGQVYLVGDELDGYIRIAVRADQIGAEKLANLQTVSVTFTPYEEAMDHEQARRKTHAAHIHHA